MRLSEHEKETLKHAALACFGQGTRLRLFGSRADVHRKGGDIDLLIESPLTDPADIAKAHTRFLSQIYDHLSQHCAQKVARQERCCGAHWAAQLSHCLAMPCGWNIRTC